MIIWTGTTLLAAMMAAAPSAAPDLNVASLIAGTPPQATRMAPETANSPQMTSRRPRTNIIYQDPVGPAFVIPVAGNTPGAFGTFFRSEVVIGNYRNVPQRIAISVLRQGVNSGKDAPIIRELPAYENDGDLGLVEEDFLGSLGKTGLAAVLVQAVDTSGNPDSTALIDGFSRIWTPTPTNSGCSDPTGTYSQPLLSVPPNSITGTQYSGFAVGLRQDENFRTNVGIVNLSPDSHTWEVDVVGTRADTSFSVTVPGNSMNQVSLPAGVYGTLSITFTATGSGTNYNWAAYGSSVDNRTGDGWTRIASY